MSSKITTGFGQAVPPAPRHSVTVHFGPWENVEQYGSNSRSVIATFDNAYPRMKPHRDIANLAEAVLTHLQHTGRACYLFSSLQSATECFEYSISYRRNNGADKTPVEPDQIEIRAFVVEDYFYAVVFPMEKANVVGGFWATPGIGISSRFAELNLRQAGRLQEIAADDTGLSRSSFETEAHQTLRNSIIRHLHHASVVRQRTPHHKPRWPSSKDVYFFPTGMAAVYKPHTYLLQSFEQGTTVLFGMAFMNTITAFEEFGPRYKFFGLGTDNDLQDLEVFLREERRQGRRAQAVWAEFPANPLLVTPDLERLHALAWEYDTILAIDDTIGGYANIDVLSMADLLWTSLTKSFNGYADVIAGSVVLNPDSRKYQLLKDLFDKHYVPELYHADAETIVINSSDYLIRMTKLNHNASSLVMYLNSLLDDPQSTIKQVYYPEINPSGPHYRQFMRPPTAEFTPGYGCLFTIEFEDMPTTIAFYDNLNVHKGPHLGAPMTLCFAYTMCAYKNKLDWAARYGLKPTQLRISAGLEDTDVLLEDFRIAVEAANKVKAAGTQMTSRSRNEPETMKHGSEWCYSHCATDVASDTKQV